MIYLGDKKVKKQSEDGETIIATLDDDRVVRLHKDLFDTISTTKKQEGTITDLINHHLAAKYLLDMSNLGLEVVMIESVASAMSVLTHNLREEAIGRAFKCTSSLDIKLSSIIESPGMKNE